jgi:phosphoribosyl-ATP pyrophosphohydrolase
VADLITSVEEHVADCDSLLHDRTAERWFRAVSEEAGEVVGAFNKWQDGNTRKPKGPADILEESGQLLMCLVASLGRIGYSLHDLLEETDRFAVVKAKAFREKGGYT